MTTLEEKIAVMQAFARGEKIEVRSIHGNKWNEAPEPAWGWVAYDYRIAKPEPKKVKLLAWLEHDTGYLNFRMESFGEPKHSASVRIPSEDKEITL